jgi:hypothetical protein
MIHYYSRPPSCNIVMMIIVPVLAITISVCLVTTYGISYRFCYLLNFDVKSSLGFR